MSSPWGPIQHSKPLIRGVREVDTAGHGGIMVSKGLGKKLLSESAIKRAIYYANCYCFEEDCDWAIPVWEIKELWPIIYVNHTMKETKEILLDTLGWSNPDYLIEIGISPSEKQLKRYKMDKEEAIMRKEKHSDLITAAVNTDQRGVVKVWTADGKEHFVNSESYQKAMELHHEEYELLLLSNCKVFESESA